MVGKSRYGYARGQTRVVDGKEVFVEIPPMTRMFTLKCDDAFYSNLEKIHSATRGRISYAAIIRELVAREAGSEVEMEARDIRKYPHQPKHERKVVVVAGSQTSGPSPDRREELLRRLRAATEESGPNNLLRAALDGKVEVDPEEFVQRMEARYGGLEGPAVRGADAGGHPALPEDQGEGGGGGAWVRW